MQNAGSYFFCGSRLCHYRLPLQCEAGINRRDTGGRHDVASIRAVIVLQCSCFCDVQILAPFLWCPGFPTHKHFRQVEV